MSTLVPLLFIGASFVDGTSHFDIKHSTHDLTEPKKENNFGNEEEKIGEFPNENENLDDKSVGLVRRVKQYVLVPSLWTIMSIHNILRHSFKITRETRHFMKNKRYKKKRSISLIPSSARNIMKSPLKIGLTPLILPEYR